MEFVYTFENDCYTYEAHYYELNGALYEIMADYFHIKSDNLTAFKIIEFILVEIDKFDEMTKYFYDELKEYFMEYAYNSYKIGDDK